MKSEDIFGGFIPFAIISITMGFVMFFKKWKIVDALVSSYKTFGFTVDEGRVIRIANIMVPIMGVIFMVAGIASLAKVIIHFI